MHAMLNIAVRAARAAGRVAMKSFQQPDQVDVTEKSRNDFVTNVDQACEQIIIETIKKVYPDHDILAEESGEQHAKGEYLWVIDPIDGTTNFLRGIPHFSISIAVLHKGVTQHAVVYDPVSEELFTASRGAGAQLNGYRIRVSSRKELEGTLLATGFPFKHKHLLSAYQAVFNKLFEPAADIRRTGSAALDLAYVAAGRVDGYWEIGIKLWDMAAGELLVREAGGMVTDFAGGMNHQISGNVVAAPPRVLQSMVTAMRPLLPASLLK